MYGCYLWGEAAIGGGHLKLCSACGREIPGEPLFLGGLALCPEVCVPEPEPDLAAQAERIAAERSKAKIAYRSPAASPLPFLKRSR
jgi:hypothetical protein